MLSEKLKSQFPSLLLRCVQLLVNARVKHEDGGKEVEGSLKECIALLVPWPWMISLVWRLIAGFIEVSCFSPFLAVSGRNYTTRIYCLAGNLYSRKVAVWGEGGKRTCD